ncbi:MAG: DPP IV N-terminal domain-containing protein [Paludibacteraceae bacterium]|nr:DPP IV N-terminal domain-containing protein [Paludibacteraceae bacterium]
MKLLLILSVLPAILAGEYNAKTLSIAEQDSILKVQGDKVQSDKVPSTRYRLERENEEQIFRHSQVAEWFVYDTMRHTRKRLGEGMFKGEEVKVRDAVMSPNGRYVAFAKGNNLYVHKLDFGTEVAVTKDENTEIINGVADWLYEEEFATTALFAWSPDSKQLAFIRLDETDVPEFSWQNYLGEVPSDQVPSTKYPQYPDMESLRYPKAGCANAKASVCVYDVATKGIVNIQFSEVSHQNSDYYFPRLRWTESGELIVLRVNRDQTKMEVFACNAKSTVSNLLYKEESKNYFVDYSLFDEWKWLSDGRIIVLSEKDGWRRAYLYNAQGIEQRMLTPEERDVTALYAVDEKAQMLYFQAAPTPSTRQIYAVGLQKSAVSVQLTEGEGIHSARFSADGKKMIDCYQSFDTPNRYTLYKNPSPGVLRPSTGRSIEQSSSPLKGGEVLLSNDSLAEAWRSNGLPEPELMKIPNGKGQELEAMLMISDKVTKDQGPKPLIVMHYSGPASQRVLNRWRKRFEYALVEEGYAVLIVDSRGGDCRGRAWRNETYMGLGIKEAEDLIAAANYIGQRPEIDADRMAILGWSYGGYETLMTMSTKGHPFKAGVAIAPVTDWRLYDSAYTERYMRRPQVNPRGYEEASLMNHVEDMSGEVLIIHGTGDDNVHVQHAMQYFDALVKADKQFEMQLYPDDNHFLRKGNNAKHMHERVLGFLERVLK